MGNRTSPARLVLADDHELVRDGFHRMLDREADLEVVGEAANGREVVEVCRKLKPDLVLMDVRMPEMDGIEATRTIKAERPDVSVLVVTLYEDLDYLLEALKAGASGYLLKDAPKTQLLNAVRRVLAGESPLNQELAAQLIQRLASEKVGPPAPQGPRWEYGGSDASPPPLEDLTPRELEVLKLVAQGNTNQQIGRALAISPGTAKVHVQNLIRKLGVSDRTHAAVRASELGLLRDDNARNFSPG